MDNDGVITFPNVATCFEKKVMKQGALPGPWPEAELAPV